MKQNGVFKKKFSDEIERRYVFQVSGPSTTLVLQASSDADRKAWITAMGGLAPVKTVRRKKGRKNPADANSWSVEGCGVSVCLRGVPVLVPVCGLSLSRPLSTYLDLPRPFPVRACLLKPLPSGSTPRRHHCDTGKGCAPTL